MLLSAFSMMGVMAAEADPAELKFSGATLSIDSDITVYFMVLSMKTKHMPFYNFQLYEIYF